MSRLPSMEFLLEVTENTIRETLAITKALSNGKRLRIFARFDNSPEMALNEIHRWAKSERIYPNETSTYRALEKLVSCRLLYKRYDSSEKRLIYVRAERER